MGRTGQARELGAWAKRLDLIAIALAFVFLVAYAVPILHPDAPASLRSACRVTIWATWALLAVEVVLRLGYADDKRAFFRSHWLDVAAVVLPILRPLRLLRLVLLLTALQKHVGGSLRGRVAVYVGGSMILISFVASLAVLEAERPTAEGNIKTYGDSIWWVATTLSTVGYGDHYPVTATGRFVAVALMVVGVALLGVVTASLATWLIESVREIEKESGALQSQDIRGLQDEVRQLRAAIESQSKPADGALAED